ncbi:MAG: hypothetical protein J7M26_05145, partial [Armatimonadetes bacterium]|nr:hypothetical protein [Armatimonadota bacterium]
MTACAAGPPVSVALDPAVRYQTILGWGKTAPEMSASPAVRDLVLDLAVNDLGLTRLRIEPPGGHGPHRRRWEWLNDNSDPDDINWSALNTGDFDQLLQQWVVPFKQRVEARGEPFDCYVSPSFFNHGSTGEVPAWLLHSPGEYAEYALSLLLYMKQKYGIAANYYCICNEAGNDNSFSPQVVARMIRALGPKLRAAGLPTAIQFPESINAREAWRYVQTVQDQPDVLQWLGLVSYHWYGKNNQQYMPKLRDFARAQGLPTAQTEYMWLKIDHLYDDLTLGRVSYWEIYGLAGPDWRAALTHVSSTTFRGGPRYWTFRQVLHYVRPGAVRIKATSSEQALRVLAFERGGRMTVVLINTSEPLQDRAVKVQGLPAGTYGVCQSVAARPYRELGPRHVGADGRLVVDVPAKAVLTIYPRDEANLPPTLTQWRSTPE